jgi:two-component system, chemotaxis family, chemotaxis protein CheY
MAERNINLRDLVILVADPSPYLGMIVHGMLRGFGANRVVEARSAAAVLEIMTGQKIDALICDGALPPRGGLALTRIIRAKENSENRTIPILIMTNNPRDAMVRDARDAGANMVVAKPLSPTNLYDRLAWIAFTSRQFVDTASYFGPDRRFKAAVPQRGGRRKDDVKAAQAAIAQGTIGGEAALAGQQR